MKISIPALVAIAQVAAAVPAIAQDSPEAGISAEELRGHVFFLASDWLQGRGIDTDGYRRAVEYTATQFAASGLTTPGGPYLQEFRFAPSSGVGDSAVSWNVVATRPGTDPEVSGEYVIVTAHLDHLGIRNGEIFNGANDNATGSAAVLEIAEALAATPTRRPVAFVLFGAEEVGLAGSQHFVDHSPIPLGDAVANLNIDGVGYYVNQQGGQLRLMGLVGNRCEALRELLEDRASESGSVMLDTGDTQNLLQRSDQWSFIQAGVPAVLFTDFDGGTDHLPIDDAAPIEYDKLEILSRFLYRVTVELANRPDPICN